MVEIYRSAVIAAPVERVWPVVRDFNGLPSWHPAIAESEIEEGWPADRVGCVRRFRTRDGGLLREKLLALSDTDRMVSYSILVSPMPVADYVATMRLTPITAGAVAAGGTFAEWWARFEVTEGTEAAMIAHIGDAVFAGGLAALARLVEVAP